MYAVVTTGGKQYKVAQGDILRVEKMDAPVGETVILTEVSMIADDDKVIIDNDALASAKVVAEVLLQGRAKKIVVFKKKRRKNYTRKRGHRQCYTQLRIREIQA